MNAILAVDPAGIASVGVVIPAHNEADTIHACLHAMTRAIERFARDPSDCDVAIGVVVVADACADSTASIARDSGVDVLEIDAHNVGVARAHGVQRLLAAPVDPARCWIATTDADSRVPDTWLSSQVAAARAGRDVLAGEVAVDDWTGHSLAAIHGFTHRYREAGAAHVHGANLGIRGDVYRAVGGFAPLELGEDQALVDAVSARGGRVAFDRSVIVRTSSRRDGRARGGFSAALHQMPPATA